MNAYQGARKTDFGTFSERGAQQRRHVPRPYGTDHAHRARSAAAILPKYVRFCEGGDGRETCQGSAAALMHDQGGFLWIFHLDER